MAITRRKFSAPPLVVEATRPKATFCFSIEGPPRTKKTHNQLVFAGGRHRLLPSKEYRRWHADAMSQLPVIRAQAVRDGVELPLMGPVQVRALFMRQRKSGDMTGYEQALGDWLQDAGIIGNDRQIEHWDGTRLMKDAIRPRVVVGIVEL